MHKLPVAFRPEANEDLAGIFRYVLLASRSAQTAENFVKRIKASCDRIGHAPLGGRPRDDLEAGLRTVAFERSAVVAYTLEADRVLITNIFYGGQDFEALYRGDSSPGH